MTNHRAQRVADLLLSTLGRLLLTDIRDPALSTVVLTRADVTSDLQVARVYYTLQQGGDRKAVEKGLARAAVFLRREVTQRLDLRRSPQLLFFYDEGLARGRRIEDILREVIPPQKSEEGPTQEEEKPNE